MLTAENLAEAIQAFRDKLNSLRPLAGIEAVAPLSELVEANNTTAIQALLKRANDLMLASIPDEANNISPRFTPRWSYEEAPEGELPTKLISIKLVLAEKGIFDVKKEFDRSFSGARDIEDILQWLQGVYEQLIVASLEFKNLQTVNQLLAAASKSANAGYTVRFVTSLEGRGDNIVYSLSDSELVLVADATRVFALSELVLFARPGEAVTEDRFNSEAFQASVGKAEDLLVESFQVASHPVKFLAEKDSFTTYLTNRGTHRLKTLLGQAFPRRVVNTLKSKKDFVAIYQADDVIAGVARKDGELELSLSPVNVETGDRVDVDVLAALAA